MWSSEEYRHLLILTLILSELEAIMDSRARITSAAPVSLVRDRYELSILDCVIGASFGDAGGDLFLVPFAIVALFGGCSFVQDTRVADGAIRIIVEMLNHHFILT